MVDSSKILETAAESNEKDTEGEEQKQADVAVTAAVESTSWTVDPYVDEEQVFDEEDRLVPLHPVYAIPVAAVMSIKTYFGAKQGF